MSLFRSIVLPHLFGQPNPYTSMAPVIERVDFNPNVLLLKLGGTILFPKATAQGWSRICGEWKLDELFGKGRKLLDREMGSALAREPLRSGSRY